MKMSKINVFVAGLLIIGAFIGGINLQKYSWERDYEARPKSSEELLEEKLAIYADYYVCTEHLLDLIDKQYHWVDGIDHQGYYESKAEVEYHDSIGIALSQKYFQKILDWEEQQNK
jgi:hypothetical protein